jgi:hypothetical protein
LEGGIKVPAIVQWKGHGHIAPGRTSSKFVLSTDLFPTFLEAAGIGVPPQVKLDGVSSLPMLLSYNDEDGDTAMMRASNNNDTSTTLIGNGGNNNYSTSSYEQVLVADAPPNASTTSSLRGASIYLDLQSYRGDYTCGFNPPLEESPHASVRIIVIIELYSTVLYLFSYVHVLLIDFVPSSFF